jgi:hypothetical protein
MIQGDYDDALDMENGATQAVEDAKYAAEECEKVDFEEIIKSIQKLVDDWSNGEDGTQLEKFIDELEVPQGHYRPGQQCTSAAAFYKLQNNDDGSTGFGLVSDCDQVTSKKVEFEIKTPRGWGDLSNIIDELTDGVELLRCWTRRTGISKCYFRQDLEVSSKIGVNIPRQGKLKVTQRTLAK